MGLTKDEVRGISAYARIALSEEELEGMWVYMNEALRMLEPIRAYDLTGVEPTFHPIGDLANVMRDDEPDASERSLGVDEALKNAEATEGRFFRVPSILGDGGEDR